MIPSAQVGLPRLASASEQLSATDVCDEDLLSAEDGTQSMDSEISRVGVERILCIWRARMVEPRGPHTDSAVAIGSTDRKCVRDEYALYRIGVTRALGVCVVKRQIAVQISGRQASHRSFDVAVFRSW
jgi:hypothetical protein